MPADLPLDADELDRLATAELNREYPPWFLVPLITQARAALTLAERVAELEALLHRIVTDAFTGECDDCEEIGAMCEPCAMRLGNLQEAACSALLPSTPPAPAGEDDG